MPPEPSPEQKEHAHRDVVRKRTCLESSCRREDWDGKLIVACLSCEEGWLDDQRTPGNNSTRLGGRYHPHCVTKKLLSEVWYHGNYPYGVWCDGCSGDLDTAILGPVLPEVVTEYRYCREQKHIMYADRTYCYSCRTWIREALRQDGEEAFCAKCRKVTCTRCKKAVHEEVGCQTLEEQAHGKHLGEYIIETHKEVIEVTQSSIQELFSKCPEKEWELCPACWRPVHSRYMHHSYHQ